MTSVREQNERCSYLATHVKKFDSMFLEENHTFQITRCNLIIKYLNVILNIFSLKPSRCMLMDKIETIHFI